MAPPLNHNEQQLYTKWFSELAGAPESPSGAPLLFGKTQSHPSPQLRIDCAAYPPPTPYPLESRRRGPYTWQGGCDISSKIIHPAHPTSNGN